MRTFGIIVLIIGLIVAFSVFGLVGKACGSAGGILDRTIDPDNVTYTYEWFFNVNAEYQATLAKVRTAKRGLDDYKEDNGKTVREWKRDQREEYARLREVLRGLENHRDSLIEKYNAGSAKANRKIFKSGKLPTRLP